MPKKKASSIPPKLTEAEQDWSRTSNRVINSKQIHSVAIQFFAD
jgi:hypothetical protein